MYFICAQPQLRFGLPEPYGATEYAALQLQIRSFFFISAIFTLFGDFHSVTSLIIMKHTPILALDSFLQFYFEPRQTHSQRVSFGVKEVAWRQLRGELR